MGLVRPYTFLSSADITRRTGDGRPRSLVRNRPFAARCEFTPQHRGAATLKSIWASCVGRQQRKEELEQGTGLSPISLRSNRGIVLSSVPRFPLPRVSVETAVTKGQVNPTTLLRRESAWDGQRAIKSLSNYLGRALYNQIAE
jgi:hypothetical protein